MLDQLPTELVLPILEHLTPPLGDVWDDPPNLTDLFSMMRVSKRLYLLARPFFWRDVRVETAGQATQLLALLHEPSARGIKQHIETLQVSKSPKVCSDESPTMAHIRALLALLPRANRLEVTAEAASFKAELSAFSALHLESMWLAFLTPKNFPSLQALSLSEIDCGAQPIESSLSDRMVPQLDLLQLFMRGLSPSCVPAGLLQSTTTPVVLIMCEPYEAVGAPAFAARHLAYFIRLQLGGIVNKLSDVFHSSYQPQTLHLFAPFPSSRLSTRNNTSADDAALLEDVEASLEICEERGVEVFWHEEDDSRIGAVSPGLWRWAKEHKVDLALENSGDGNEASTSG
ncbi:hypothetical protein JCM10207_006360 [Rhodosporidiobolus poonsookiae]